MYQNEMKKLKGMLSEQVYNLLKENKAVIAGGAITSLFSNKEINDLDVYLPSQRAVVNVLASALGEEEYTYNEVLDSHQLIFTNMTKKSMLFVDKDTQVPVQLITFQFFDKPEEIFETFDFTVCMGAFVLETEEFVFHPEFFKHVAQRYLKYNPKTAFPLISSLRVDKYKQKGYFISKSEFLRIVLSCMNLEINSWIDFKEHIGGMYGYNMDEVFNEEREFSVDEGISQLNLINEVLDYKFKPLFPSFQEALEMFDSAEEMEGEECPYKEGFYYKHVLRATMGSPVQRNSKSIKYEVGSIVNGGDMGIYVHTDPLNPFSHYSNCVVVELEHLSSQVISPSIYCGSGQKQLIGDVRVVRIVPHYDPKDSKPMRKYRISDKEWEAFNKDSKVPLRLI